MNANPANDFGINLAMGSATWSCGSSCQWTRLACYPWWWSCSGRFVSQLLPHSSHGSCRISMVNLGGSPLAFQASLGAKWRLEGRCPRNSPGCGCTSKFRLFPHSSGFLSRVSLSLDSHGRRYHGPRARDLLHDQYPDKHGPFTRGVVVTAADEGSLERFASGDVDDGHLPVATSNVPVHGAWETEGDLSAENAISLLQSWPSVSVTEESATGASGVVGSCGLERQVAGCVLVSTSKSTVRFAIPVGKTFSKLLPMVEAERALILRAWVCTLLAAWCVVQAVPQIGQLSVLLSEGNLRQLLRLGTWLLALIAVRSAAQYFQDTWLWEAALRVTLSLREKAYAHLQTLDMDFFEGRNSTGEGDLAYRVIAESEDAGEMVYSIIQRFVPSVVQLVVVISHMVLLSPSLTAATLAVVPCMALVIAKLGEQLRGLSRRGQDSIAGLAAYVSEVLPAMLIVKTYGAETLEMERFRFLAGVDLSARLEKKRCKAMMPLAITGVYAITVLVLFVAGTWAISRRKFTGAGMVSFVTSLVLLVEPIQAVSTAYNEIKQGEPALERIFELMVKHPKVVDRMGAKDKVDAIGHVEVRNVSFRYSDGGPWALKNVSFEAKEGETIALVGPSGSGKTTLAKMLLRLYDPQEGSIFLDGQDIRGLTLRCLRRLVSIVPQDTVIFSGNVVTNIAYGKLPHEIDVEAVKCAARLGNAHEFIDRLPEKYLTELGSRGSSLSGGQRQRLSIARAIYRSPTVLVLDEATSALDNQSEKLIREALERLMKGRTVLVIAHRLQTIRNADRIMYMEGGRILEEGKHDELLAQGGRYSMLYEQQASQRGDDDSSEGQMSSIDLCGVEAVTVKGNAEMDKMLGQSQP